MKYRKYPTRYLILVGSILISLLSNNCRMTEKDKTPTITRQQDSQFADPIAIHRRAIAIDMHADTAQRLVDEQVDLQARLADGHFDSVRAREGGLDAQFFRFGSSPSCSAVVDRGR